MNAIERGMIERDANDLAINSLPSDVISWDILKGWYTGLVWC